MEVVADLAFIKGTEFLAEEGGDVVGFDGMNGGAHEGVVEGF